NSPPGQPIANEGCAKSTCHGSASNPLHISTTLTPAQNLASFGCFINAQAPSLSAVLACPLNEPGCPKSPHPGQRVFRDTTDLNYQRILSYLYSTKTVSSPLDFAFFARQVQPLFNDPANGGLGRRAGDPRVGRRAAPRRERLPAELARRRHLLGAAAQSVHDGGRRVQAPAADLRSRRGQPVQQRPVGHAPLEQQVRRPEPGV